MVQSRKIQARFFISTWGKFTHVYDADREVQQLCSSFTWRKGTESKLSTLMRLWNDALYTFSSGRDTMTTASVPRNPLLSHFLILRFIFLYCANGDDIFGIGTQDHIPYTVKVDELGRGVIEHYSAHFARGLLRQNPCVYDYARVVLGPPDSNSSMYLSGPPSSFVMSPSLFPQVTDEGCPHFCI